MSNQSFGITVAVHPRNYQVKRGGMYRRDFGGLEKHKFTTAAVVGQRISTGQTADIDDIK